MSQHDYDYPRPSPDWEQGSEPGSVLFTVILCVAAAAACLVASGDWIRQRAEEQVAREHEDALNRLADSVDEIAIRREQEKGDN